MMGSSSSPPKLSLFNARKIFSRYPAVLLVFVAAISATVPGKYLIDTLADGKQVRGVVYDHKCYLSKDFVSWVSDKLWTGTSATTTPAVSHTYGFTGIVDGVYKNCVK